MSCNLLIKPAGIHQKNNNNMEVARSKESGRKPFPKSELMLLYNAAPASPQISLTLLVVKRMFSA